MTSEEDCRQKVADFYQLDVMIVAESWLKEEEVAVLKGYRWWGRNRKYVNERAVFHRVMRIELWNVNHGREM